MTDRLAAAMQEVWDWKADAEARTQGMTQRQLIDFYQQAGDDTLEKMGVALNLCSSAPTDSSVRDRS